MAVNAYTLDRCKRTHYFRVNENQVPIQLPFDMLEVDGEVLGYQPVTYRGRTEKADAIKGSSAGAVFLSRNTALPMGEGPNASKMAVFFYAGV